MASHTRPSKLRVDRDGVRVEVSGVRGRVWLLASAIGLVGLGLVILLRPVHHLGSDEVTAVPAPEPAAPPPNAAPGDRLPAKPLRAAVAVNQRGVPPPAVRERPAPASAESAPEAPDEAAPPEAPQEEAPMFGGNGAPGEGVAVFPPPGTKPIKRGILVPEGFELPPGYVRHYQATDDGQRVPAILMFHPDYHPVDEHGVPIPLPPDLVVPPDMAPPGMPIEMLQPPENPSTEPDAAGGQSATP